MSAAEEAAILALLRQSPAADPAALQAALSRVEREALGAAQKAQRQAILAAMPRLADDPRDAVAGNPAGTRVLVEFYDVRCPYCRAMMPMIGRMLDGDPALRLVLKEWAILGPVSESAARALLAARAFGKYFPLRARLMTGPAPQSEAEIRAAAEAVGLAWPALASEMAGAAISRQLADTRALAREIGLVGTPSFIARGAVMAGAVSEADLRAALAGA
jgi:protein-disulfide isomerase